MKKISLSKLLNLKEAVENNIAQLLTQISKMNKSNLNLQTLVDNLYFYLDYMVVVKEKIRDANAKKHPDKNTNDYYIYLLSNVNRLINFYSNLRADSNSTITDVKVDEYLKNLRQERKDIIQKLSSFNDKTMINIDASDERISKYI